MKIKPSILCPRRHFLKTTAAAFASINIVPASILGLRGATPPSEKVNIAGIGVAGQGGHDLNQFKDHNIVALCDVDSAHAANTFKQFPRAKVYKDFRRMLEGATHSHPLQSQPSTLFPNYHLSIFNYQLRLTTDLRSRARSTIKSKNRGINPVD